MGSIEEVGILVLTGELLRVPRGIACDSIVDCPTDGLGALSVGMMAATLLRAGGAIGPKGDPYETGQGERSLSGEFAAVIQETQCKYLNAVGIRWRFCRKEYQIRTHGISYSAAYTSRCCYPSNGRGRS